MTVGLQSIIDCTGSTRGKLERNSNDSPNFKVDVAASRSKARAGDYLPVLTRRSALLNTQAIQPAAQRTKTFLEHGELLRIELAADLVRDEL